MNRSRLYLLAFDHRRSYEVALADASRDVLAAGKAIVANALAATFGEGDAQPGTGLLIDSDYGPRVLEQVPDGLATALAIERSGQRIFEVEHSDWTSTLDSLTPTFAKVLVRFRADDAPADRSLQIERLREVQAALADRPTRFLFEILTPLTADEQARAETDLDDVRLPILSNAITELHDSGLDPDLWKVEGLDHAASCAAIAQQCRAARSDVQLVVLGAGAPAATVDRWLVAAAEGGYDGFAVGRSIWKDPLTAWASGKLSEVEAAQEVVSRYQHFVDVFTATADALGTCPEHGRVESQG